jgi:hypothetical protein
VDHIFDEFRNDYYPGEAVTVHILGGERLQGVVRDKTRFGSKVQPDGSLAAPFSRYFVSLDMRPDEEAVVDDQHIFRDRKVFTKAVLRSFIKKTVTREAWNGAPWLVKHDVAEKYHIDTRIPPHLRYDNKLLERKQMQLQKKASQFDSSVVSSGSVSPTGFRLPELKPAPKSHKSKAQQALQAQQNAHKGKHSTFGGLEPGTFMHLPLPGNPFQFPMSFRGQVPPPIIHHPDPTPPPPPLKYPIEDLLVEPRGFIRPPLSFMCSDTPVDVPSERKSPLSDKILMKSIGPLLETWDTLNVYCEIFKLDSFTFDDYVEAMLVASAHTPVQLFDEIHCAVLKILVTSEAEGGKVQIQLPELDEEEEEEEEDEEEAESTAPTPEPDPQPSGRATRRSLAKAEADRLAAEAAAAEKEMQDAEDTPKHQAEELLRDGYDWIEHLKKRDFKDGGWELIMVGLLHQLSKNDRLRASCEELLQQLVPADVEPSQETVRERYAALDVNYRVQALQIICMLTSETRAIRGYMEDCSETMTAYRKEKIEWQRKRKQLWVELLFLLFRVDANFAQNRGSQGPQRPAQDPLAGQSTTEPASGAGQDDQRGCQDVGCRRPARQHVRRGSGLGRGRPGKETAACQRPRRRAEAQGRAGAGTEGEGRGSRQGAEAVQAVPAGAQGHPKEGARDCRVRARDRHHRQRPPRGRLPAHARARQRPLLEPVLLVRAQRHALRRAARQLDCVGRLRQRLHLGAGARRARARGLHRHAARVPGRVQGLL